jgi:hypothetical protein
MNSSNGNLPRVTSPGTSPTALTVVQQQFVTIRSRLGTRGLFALGAVVIAAGLALNWSWVVALGLAPIVLSLAPCAAMCALGLCMMPKSKDAGIKPPAVSESSNGTVSLPPSQDAA